MNNKSALKIATKIDSFPTLPTVVTELLKITAEPESTMDDLMKTIHKDPSLSVNILKFANSAFFGRIMGVSSLKEAVSVLGFAEIRNIVLAKAIFNSFKHVQNRGTFTIQKFWEHSFLCGLAAKIIAENLNFNASDFFMAGLIHDIGKLIFFIEIQEKFMKISEASIDLPYKVFENEKKYMGMSHDQAGLLLLNRWLFPENLLSAVGYHHCPKQAKTEMIFPTVIHVADIMTYQLESVQDTSADTTFIGKLLTRQEIFSLFELHEIQWDREIIQNIVEKYNIQKHETASMLKELGL